MDTLMTGIHFGEGMQNYGNDSEQYFNVLKFFYEDANAHINKMKQFFHQKKYDVLLFEIHALKGLAVGIGAKDLSERARELERAIKESNIEYIESNALPLLEQYEQIRTGIEDVLHKIGKFETSAKCKGHISKEEMLDILFYIMDKNALLEQNLAEEAMKNLLSYSISDNLRRMFECVKSEIADFEYRKANDLLIKIVEEMKSEIGANNE